ncbi:hypothetical protein [Paenibacillus sp. NPDC058174]
MLQSGSEGTRNQERQHEPVRAATDHYTKRQNAKVQVVRRFFADYRIKM